MFFGSAINILREILSRDKTRRYMEKEAEAEVDQLILGAPVDANHMAPQLYSSTFQTHFLKLS